MKINKSHSQTSQLQQPQDEGFQGGKMMAPPAFKLSADSSDSPTDQLRGAGTSGGGAASGESTSGGEWEAPTYDLVSMGPQLGAQIELRFKPNTKVDATKIGLIQTAKAIKNGAPYYLGDKTRESHAIGKSDAITVDPSSKETDEGTHVDHLGESANPLYATDPGSAKPGDNLETTPTDPDYGQHGWRYKDAAKKEQKQDAVLKDQPTQRGVEKNSSNTFEVAAIALTGNQKGAYYGSVKWGWKTDAAGKHTKLPLQVASKGVPSSSFMKAGEMWNQGKTSNGGDTIDLPIVDVKVAAMDMFEYVPKGEKKTPVKLPKGTRLQVTSAYNTPMLYGTVKVVDGPLTGSSFKISSVDWTKIIDERP